MASRMKTRVIKTVLYALLAVGFFLLAAFYNSGMHKTETIAASYFQVQRWILLIGAVLLGTGITFRKAARADAWFIIAVGAALLVFFVVTFLQYGAMTTVFDEAGYTVANVQLLALHGVGVASLVRAVVLASGLRDAATAARRTAWFACIAAAGLLLCLLITGAGTRFARYEQPTEEAYTDTI